MLLLVPQITRMYSCGSFNMRATKSNLLMVYIVFWLRRTQKVATIAHTDIVIVVAIVVVVFLLFINTKSFVGEHKSCIVLFHTLLIPTLFVTLFVRHEGTHTHVVHRISIHSRKNLIRKRVNSQVRPPIVRPLWWFTYTTRTDIASLLWRTYCNG